MGVTAEGHSFEYVIHVEQKASYEKPRIVKEAATCDKRSLFERDLDGVRFQKADGTQTGFPWDWRQAALASMQPKGSLREIAILQEAISKLLILRPNPRGMEKESKRESKHPDLHVGHLTSWYRSLSQEQDRTDAQQVGITKEQFDQVVFVLAKDRLENWIEFLLTGATDESREGPRQKYDRPGAEAAKSLAKRCMSGAAEPKLPPSLAWSCMNWRKLVERMRR